MKVSATLKIQEIVKKRKEQGLSVYNFGLGANPLPISHDYLNVIKKYANNKNYISACGVDKFQKVIKKIYSNDNYKIENVLTGNGLKELLFVVQMAFDGIIIQRHEVKKDGRSANHRKQEAEPWVPPRPRALLEVEVFLLWTSINFCKVISSRNRY